MLSPGRVGAGGQGAGRVFAGNSGGGGVKYFFQGPKFPPRNFRSSFIFRIVPRNFPLPNKGLQPSAPKEQRDISYKKKKNKKKSKREYNRNSFCTRVVIGCLFPAYLQHPCKCVRQARMERIQYPGPATTGEHSISLCT